MPTALITSRDQKGLHIVGLFEAVLNKAKLDDDRAQRLIENGDELKGGLRELIAKLSVPNQFASEEVAPAYGYPAEYRGPKPIGEQVDILAKIFGLSLGYTSDFIANQMPKFELPEGAEGWFAIPSVEAVRKRFFPEVTDPAEAYCRAVMLVLEKLGASRKFKNWREGEITPDRLRVTARTASAMDLLAQQQPGDILILPAQFGKLHGGRSVRRAREVMVHPQFGLGAFAVGSMALTHPERFVRWQELDVDCAGDEFAPDADGQFVNAPFFVVLYDVVGLGFDTLWYRYALDLYGSASGFFPQ